MMRFTINEFSVVVVVILLAIGSTRWCLADLDPPQCGKQAGDALCHSQLCCSAWGFCGSTEIYCGQGCQSQCTGTSPPPYPPPPPSPPPPPPPSPPPPPPPLLPDEYLISREVFNEMLKNRDDIACEGRGFYTYEAFVEAAKTFPKFGNEGDSEDVKKREIAAFFGQSSQETSGGHGKPHPLEWGYCFVKQQNVSRPYCIFDIFFSCPRGKEYYGRGPLQMTWNVIYGMCGNEIGVDLINNPEILTTDPVISFKAALWVWMNPHPFSIYYGPMPPAHDVMVGTWVPSSSELADGKFPGYGMTTYLVALGIRGSTSCGLGYVTQEEINRIRFYARYCDILGVDYGNHLDCSGFRSSNLISSA